MHLVQFIDLDSDSHFIEEAVVYVDLSFTHLDLTSFLESVWGGIFLMLGSIKGSSWFQKLALKISWINRVPIGYTIS